MYMGARSEVENVGLSDFLTLGQTLELWILYINLLMTWCTDCT